DLMQADLRAALNSRARLAALGEAVAKINHDLKNMLTSAQIASERLAALHDPKVSQALPRLERALDRAVKLASGVLAYGKTQEAAPEPRPVVLGAAVEAAAEEARRAEARMRLGGRAAWGWAWPSPANSPRATAATWRWSPPDRRGPPSSCACPARRRPPRRGGGRRRPRIFKPRRSRSCAESRRRLGRFAYLCALC